jgi:hypothetical protein
MRPVFCQELTYASQTVLVAHFDAKAASNWLASSIITATRCVYNGRLMLAQAEA